MRNPLGPAAPGRREILIATALLTLLALAIYLPHMIRGGWYVDDWIDIAQLTETSGLIDGYHAMKVASYRPGLAFTLSAVYSVAEQTQWAYLLIGALLAAAQSALFYVVLRRLGLRGPIAATAAAIFVVLPCIDASRLWYAAFPIQVAGILYLGGLLIALHGLRNAVGRRAVAWHAGAAILYFAAVLTYELVAGLIAVSFLLYAVRGGWRPALRRLPTDLAAIALALALIAPRASEDRDAVLTIGFLWDRMGQVLAQAEAVFRWLFPLSELLTGPFGLILLALAMLGAGISIGRGDGEARAFASWLWIVALGTVFALAGLVMLLPADPYFVPRTTGTGNRIGAFAALGTVLLLISTIVLVAAGIGVLARRARLGFYVGMALVVLVGANLAVRELRQQTPWAESWDQQQQVLAAIETAMGDRVPAGATIVSFGHTTYILPADVLVFANSWDLRGAVWETFDRPNSLAHPWEAGGSCDAAGLDFPDDAGPYPYGKLFFVDVPTQTRIRVGDQAACAAAVAELTGEEA